MQPPDEKELNSAIAANIVSLRKANGWTQTQLADMIHYSDKSVSKWERGEGMPDITVLAALAAIFNVSLDQLCGLKEIKTPRGDRGQRLLVHALSVGLCFLAAAVIYAVIRLAGVNWPNAWLLFVYALPAGAVVSIVFSALWWKPVWLTVSVSVLIWSLALSVRLSVSQHGANAVFIIAGVMQVLCLLWFRLKNGKNAQTSR